MATTCTYRLPDTDVLADPSAAISITHQSPEGATTRVYCTDPATHVTRCRWDQLDVWNVFAEDERADFCLTHADVVSTQRQESWRRVQHA